MTKKKQGTAPAPDPLVKMHEDLMIQYNNLSMEMEEQLKEGGGKLSESTYSDLDWQNRIDRDYLWVRTSGAENNQFKFMTKEIIDMYADMVDYMYVYSPLVGRVVKVKSQFTFALDFSITSQNNEQVEKIQKGLNKQAVFSHKAIVAIDKSLMRSGNVFFAIWKDKQQIRAWPNREIRDIVLDKDDSDRPLFYIRTWQDQDGKSHKKAYPSIYTLPTEIPKDKMLLSYAGNSYEVDTSITVYHMTEEKDLKSKFALSPLISTCRWTKPHEKFLEDFAAIVAAYRKYSHMMTTKGGAAQVSALSGQFAGNQSYMGTALQSNPAGSMVIASEGNELKTIDAGSGKIIGIEGARSLLMNICAASGVPETFLTMDPSTGNLATSKEISPVFIMLIQERQTAWKDAFEEMFEYMLESDDFEVSFPPIRDNINAYIENVNKLAFDNAGNWKGTFKPKDYIKASHEALEWKLPDDSALDELVAAFEENVEAVPEEPTTSTNPFIPGQPARNPLDNIAIAAQELAEAVRLKEADDTQWITIGGQHIPIKQGQSKSDAVKQALGDKSKSGGKSGSSTPKAGGDASSKSPTTITPSKSPSEDGDKTLIKAMTKASNRDVGTKMALETEKNLAEHTAYGKTFADNDDINNYTSTGYAKINYDLREGKAAGANAKQIAGLDKMIAGSPKLPEGTVLYRGVGERGVNLMMGMKPGDTCDDKGFQSFSTSPFNANAFTTRLASGGKETKVMIRAITTGKENGLVIGGGEHEVLMPRGSGWKVVSNTPVKQGRLTTHVITVVPR